MIWTYEKQYTANQPGRMHLIVPTLQRGTAALTLPRHRAEIPIQIPLERLL